MLPRTQDAAQCLLLYAPCRLVGVKTAARAINPDADPLSAFAPIGAFGVNPGYLAEHLDAVVQVVAPAMLLGVGVWKHS